MSDFIYKLKRVKISDYLQIWKLIVAIIPAFLYRLFNQNLWIISEDPYEARDNGYWMFKYIREKHPDQKIVFAIKKASVDYEKVKQLGDTVEYGSLMHWILYLASSKKIGSQKAMSPNAAIFYALEVLGPLKDKRIFLQHGITVNDAIWLHYETTKFTRFICGAQPEYDYIKKHFSYPNEHIVYTGFSRFDQLHNVTSEKNLILIMPTWREWIADEDYRLKEYERTEIISETNYFKKWTFLIQNQKIEEIAQQYGVKFLFFPHRNMQKYKEFFPKSNEYIEIAFNHDYDIQDLLKRASLLITDYSSVFFDFIYMKKPVLFYQFDYEQFRKGQYGEGFFDYRNNAFSKSSDNQEELFSNIIDVIQKDYKVSNEYLEAHQNYFSLYDTNNCERIYNVIEEL